VDVLRIVAATGPVPSEEGPTGPDIPWVLIAATAALVVGALVAWRRPSLRRPSIAVVAIIAGLATALVILITDGWANSTTGTGTSAAALVSAVASVAAGVIVAGLALERRRGSPGGA
jgi:peptidoglycan/LPS O-acetylase OafA/YrhL